MWWSNQWHWYCKQKRSNRATTIYVTIDKLLSTTLRVQSKLPATLSLNPSLRNFVTHSHSFQPRAFSTLGNTALPHHPVPCCLLCWLPVHFKFLHIFCNGCLPHISFMAFSTFSYHLLATISGPVWQFCACPPSEHGPNTVSFSFSECLMAYPFLFFSIFLCCLPCPSRWCPLAQDFLLPCASDSCTLFDLGMIISNYYYYYGLLQAFSCWHSSYSLILSHLAKNHYYYYYI